MYFLLTDSDLVGMGFTENLVVEALRQTDNNQENSLNLLTTSPELLTVKSNRKRPLSDYSEQVATLTGMGFSPSIALGTIQLTNGDLDKAIECCLTGKGVEAAPESPTATPNTDNSTTVTTNPVPSDVMQQLMTQSLLPNNVEQLNPTPMQVDPKQQEQEAQMQAAEDELLQDFDGEEDSHLDVSLEEEEATLTEYNSLLSAVM